MMIVIDDDENDRCWLIMMMMTSSYSIQIPDFTFASMVIYLWVTLFRTNALKQKSFDIWYQNVMGFISSAKGSKR